MVIEFIKHFNSIVKGRKKISIENDNSGRYLRVLFELNDAHTEATIRISPDITVKWATLLQ